MEDIERWRQFWQCTWLLTGRDLKPCKVGAGSRGSDVCRTTEHFCRNRPAVRDESMEWSLSPAHGFRTADLYGNWSSVTDREICSRCALLWSAECWLTMDSRGFKGFRDSFSQLRQPLFFQLSFHDVSGSEDDGLPLLHHLFVSWHLFLQSK